MEKLSSLTFYDNNNGKKIELQEIKDDLSRFLNEISGKKIVDLLIENKNNIIFVPDVKNDKSEIESNFMNKVILRCKKDEDKYIVYTYNIIGFIGKDKNIITIGSRFDKDNNTHFFLQYMFEKVYRISLFKNFQTSSEKNNIFKFILYIIFLNKLNKALAKGVYKEYIYKKSNNSKVKGMIDIPVHIKLNVPFLGKIAYKTREFSYNNRINNLLRYTVEFIKRKFHYIKNNEFVQTISLLNSFTDYDKKNLKKLILENINPVKNPFFKDYELLRKMALLILYEKGYSFSSFAKNKIYGFLVDISWLWEEYLNVVLKDINDNNLKLEHPQNIRRSEPVYIFKKDNKRNYRRYPRYPDFYITDTDKDKNKSNESKSEVKIVIDAKYKHLKGEDISREDIHQIITYLYILKSKIGIFLNPKEFDFNNNKKTENNNIINEIGEINGYGGKIHILNFFIPQKESKYDSFKDLIEKGEEEIKKIIKEIINL